MPVTRKKRRKKMRIEKIFNFSQGSKAPTPEEIVQNPEKPRGSFDAKKPLNKKVVSKKEFHRTSNK